MRAWSFVALLSALTPRCGVLVECSYDISGGRPSNATLEWNIQASAKASRTRNPIRAIVDNIANQTLDTDKDMIPLSIGDPTIYGNLKAPDALIDAIVAGAKSFKSNGYAHSAGVPAARQAVATYFSHPGATVTADDVVIASGGSGALELAITAILNEGDNILVPAPGFPLYEVIAESNGAHVKKYPLDPQSDWEVDIPALEALVNSRTRAILVNNPSNPCGSVLPDHSLKAVLRVAEDHRLLVIADEIYGSMTFEGVPFTPIASLSETVPVLSVGGLAKMFLVPGWRVGWILIHDPKRLLDELRQGLINLTQLVLGANTLVQHALPTVLVKPFGSESRTETDADVRVGEGKGEGAGVVVSSGMDTGADADNCSSGTSPGSSLSTLPGSGVHAQMVNFRNQYVSTLEAAARYTTAQLRTAHGLSVVEPRGAMYVMVRIRPEKFSDINDDKEFAQKLLTEEAVFVLPGTAFYAPNFFRVVFTAPIEKLSEAYSRIIEFCDRHRAL